MDSPQPIIQIETIDAYFEKQGSSNSLDYLQLPEPTEAESLTVTRQPSFWECSPRAGREEESYCSQGSHADCRSTFQEESSLITTRKVDNKSKQIKKTQKQLIREEERLICKSKGRKNQEQLEILVKAFQKYNGKWDESNFRQLVRATGFTKRQLNKWFWDRKKKVRDALKTKKLSYPGLLFEITDARTGRDLTPSFKTIICNQPIFQTTKVTRPATRD